VFNREISEYYQGWEAADQYAFDVINGDVITNIHVKETCARYIYDRTRKDIEFRVGCVDQAIKFTNLLKHVKGAISGNPMLLMNWQIFIVANLLGFYFTKGLRKGERRFTKGLCLVGRGNSKTTLAACLSTLFMLTSPNGSPSVFSAARTRAQAALSFTDTKKMINGADFSIRSMFEVHSHDISGLINDSLFKPLASEAQSVDGLRSSLNIIDELASHTSGEMMSTLITGTSATKDPLTFSISTAGIQLDGVCVHERNLVRDINADLIKEDSYFGIEFSIDDDDEWDDEQCWIKSNPALGHAVNINSLRSELARAKQSQVNKTAFKTKYLNVFVNTNNNPYISTDELEINCARNNLNIKSYKGRECYVGIDGAQRFDLASTALLFPEDDGSLTVFFRHYVPRGALKKLTSNKFEMYTQWEADGLLTITEGNSIDFEFIKDDIRFAAKNFKLQMVGYDPYALAQVAIELENEKIEMVEVRQGYAQLSEPSKLLQSLVSDGLLNYDKNDKVFLWCMANACMSEDQNANIKVHKDKLKIHDKIDCVIALITGLNPQILKQPKKHNSYTTRGMISI